MLQVYDKNVHLSGKTLPECVRVHRIKVVTAFLKAGVPLNRLDCFHEILEESVFRLTGCDNLCDYIPFVQQQEQKSVNDQINGRQVSVIFYGTTHVCEALVIVLRFVDEKWNLQQRVQLMLLAKSMSGEELALQLIVCLSTELSIISANLLAV